MQPFFSENQKDPKSIEQPLNLAMKYLSYQPRTIHETNEYLQKKGFDDGIAQKIIEILLDKDYLDDMNFAKLFVESKVRHKAKSKFAFGYDLKKKGISDTIIESVLARYDDQNLALKAVDRKIKTWKNLDHEEFKKKMTNFLRYRGFNYDVILSTLNHFTVDEDD